MICWNLLSKYNDIKNAFLQFVKNFPQNLLFESHYVFFCHQVAIFYPLKIAFEWAFQNMYKGNIYKIS
jgi:hypothetical protein